LEHPQTKERRYYECECDRAAEPKPPSLPKDWPALRDCHRYYSSAFSGQKIHDCLRAISRIDEQGGIFGSEMYRVSPLRVWLDSCEGLVDERLHPPRSRPGEKNNSLPRKSPSDAAFDGIQLIGTTLAGQRNLGGLYRRRWNALSGTTTT